MPPTMPFSRTVRFGLFELDVRAGELRKRGLRVTLQGLPIQILTILLENRGQVVTREDLRTRLWPADTFVDFDHSLHNAIARLREALGEDATNPRFIETLPRRGYRFLGQLDVIPQPAVTPGQPLETFPGRLSKGLRAQVVLLALVCFLGIAAVGTWMYVLLHRNNAISQVKSIAVLPLENLSGDLAQEYFADGITDELITALAKIHSMKVISRTSAMQYKGVHKPLPKIARELGVDTIVEGTVTRVGNRVRITAQLIDAPGDRHLWAENYDRDLGDVVTLQNQIARAIADEIRAKLTPEESSQLARERPVNPAAHEAYLMGRFHWNKRTEEELKTGIDYFNQAVAEDPRYAEAYVGLADSYNILGSWVFTSVPSKEARAKSVMYANKALTIDDTLGEAHTSLANLKLLFDWDWEGSEAEFKRAIVLSPNYANARHWHAELLLDLGQFDESIRESYKAKELDPLAPMMSSGVAHRLCAAGRLEEAIQEAKSALELNPNLPLAHMDLGDVYLRQANFAEAIAEFKKTVQLSHNNPNFVADLAYAYAASGDRDHAWELLKDLQQMARSRHVPPYQLAAVYAGLGEKRLALQALDEAYKEQSPWMNNLLLDRRLDSLRKEPEFARLLAAMKFPDKGQMSPAKH